MTKFATRFDIAAQFHMHEHGESVSYYRTGAYSPNVINATVVRNESEILREVGDVTNRSMILAFLSSADPLVGILPGEVNTDTDYVEMSYRVGDTPERFQICRVLSSHAGLTRVLVQ